MSSSQIYTDFQGLDRLRGAVRDTDQHQKAISETANQFEAMFLQLVLKSMRSASMENDLFNSDTSSQYRDLLDSQLAVSLAEKRPFGIAAMIEQQLSNTPSSDNNYSTNSQYYPDTKNPESFNITPENFIKQIWDEAVRTGQEIGVDQKALLAQAALETGWGKFMLRHEDGRNSYNLFGIKAGSDWQGERISHLTTEFENGQYNRRHEIFRSYNSYQEAFDDYRSVLGNNRYTKALTGLQNSLDFGHALSNAGYSTDPQYGEKIRSIMKGEFLSTTISSLIRP